MIFLAFTSTETSSFGSSVLPSGKFLIKASLSSIEPSGIGILASKAAIPIDSSIL